jgi:hypothetical protein
MFSRLGSLRTLGKLDTSGFEATWLEKEGNSIYWKNNERNQPMLQIMC